MDSDDDYLLLEQVSRPPRFKRLRKAPSPSPQSVDDVFDFPKVDLEAREDELVSSQETRFHSALVNSREELEDFRTLGEDSANPTQLVPPHNSKDGKQKLDFDVLVADEQCKEVKRSLHFGEDHDQKINEQNRETEEDLESGDVVKDIHDKEIEDLNMEKLGIQQDVEGDGNLKEDDKKKKKKRTKGDIGGEVKPKELASNRSREAKERREFLQQLHVDTQRLLRESKDASFKPIPVVHKPISSVLEKIRKRKLEVSKKTMMLSRNNSIHRISTSSEVMMEVDAKSTYSERIIDELEIELEGKVEACTIESSRTTDTSIIDGISVSPIMRSSKIRPDEMALEGSPSAVFRAPVDDTQDLFDDSETSNKDEMHDDRASSPLEEVMAPSLLALNLKFDSAPLDESSSDEEDSDKENINPREKEGGDGSSSQRGDPVKAFVDDEAEEEDDSDNDLLCFGDNEEEDIDDSADLHDIIATDYVEKSNDTEKRNELHQKWLEQQDAAGTENLLQRLKCGVEQKETMLVDDELDRNECDEEVNDVTDTDAVPKNTARLNSKKAKQMIMQMFVDKDDVFLSDEDEQTEKRLVKQRMLYNSELTTVVSPIDGESSSEIFGLIKKLNTLPDNKRKPKASSFFDTVLGDQKKKSCLKSSFLGRVKNNLPPSHKQSSTILRSFIFGREDSNSRSSMSMSEDSSDMAVKEKSRTKFAKASSEGKGGGGTSAAAPLFDLLKRSSAPSNDCSRDVLLDLPKPLLADLRISKRLMKVEGKR